MSWNNPPTAADVALHEASRADREIQELKARLDRIEKETSCSLRIMNNLDPVKYEFGCGGSILMTGWNRPLVFCPFCSKPIWQKKIEKGV